MDLSWVTASKYGIFANQRLILQLTLDVKDILELKILRPVCRRTFELHLLRAHGDDHDDLQRQGFHNILQVTCSFQISKQ